MGKVIGFDQPVVEADQAGILRGNQWLIHPFSWHLRRHQHTAVLGLNGAGKSVLMQLLTGARMPTMGKIRLLRHDPEEATPVQLRLIQSVAMPMDERFGYDLQVEEVIMSARVDAEQLGVMHDRHLPDFREIVALTRLEHAIGSTYGKLNPGERMRVLIARALMMAPVVLVLDDPTGGLDPVAREQVRSVMAAIAGDPSGPTMIMMTHKVEDLIPDFHHTLLLHAGHVVRYGLTGEIINDQLLSEIWQVPVRVQWLEHRPVLRIGLPANDQIN